MTKQEFDAIVKDAVAAGADRGEAEAYVIRGHKIPTDKSGKPVFEKAAAPPKKRR